MVVPFFAGRQDRQDGAQGGRNAEGHSPETRLPDGGAVQRVGQARRHARSQVKTSTVPVPRSAVPYLDPLPHPVNPPWLSFKIMKLDIVFDF